MNTKMLLFALTLLATSPLAAQDRLAGNAPFTASGSFSTSLNFPTTPPPASTPSWQLLASASGGALFMDDKTYTEMFPHSSIPTYGGALSIRYIAPSGSYGISGGLSLSYLTDSRTQDRWTFDSEYDPGYVEYAIFYRDHAVSYTALPINIGVQWTHNPLDDVSFWIGAAITKASMSLHQEGFYNIESGFDEGIVDSPVDESVSTSGSGWQFSAGTDIHLTTGLSLTIHGSYGALEYEESETLIAYHAPVRITDFHYVDNIVVMGRTFQNPGVTMKAWGLGAGLSYVIGL